MLDIKHNLEYEKRLIELLGYSIIGQKGVNHWYILDENKNHVGFIRYKKLHNANKKKGYEKTFGYHTVIDSSSIKYDFTRKLTDMHGKKLNYYDYSFDIKRDNDIDNVEMSIGEYPYINLWSKKYGFMSFSINSRGLHLNYKSHTDNFKIEETVIYENINDDFWNDNRYVYVIKYCKNNYDLSDDKYKGITQREISGMKFSSLDKKNSIGISERTWVGRILRTNRKGVVEGTVEEMAIKHGMGIDSFNHFRFLINKIIPFKEDVISAMVPDDIIKNRCLSIFFDSNEKNNLKDDKNTSKIKIKEKN